MMINYSFNHAHWNSGQQKEVLHCIFQPPQFKYFLPINKAKLLAILLPKGMAKTW